MLMFMVWKKKNFEKTQIWKSMSFHSLLLDNWLNRFNLEPSKNKSLELFKGQLMELKAFPPKIVVIGISKGHKLIINSS
jgi:hypothetical protein